MEKYLILMVEPKKPVYMRWASEEEIEQMSIEFDVGMVECVEVLPNGDTVNLYVMDMVLCDEYGRTYIYDVYGEPIGVEELSDDPSDPFSCNNVRVVELNGSKHLLIGKGFVLLTDIMFNIINLTPKLIVRYERLLNKYLGVEEYGRSVSSNM